MLPDEPQIADAPLTMNDEADTPYEYEVKIKTALT